MSQTKSPPVPPVSPETTPKKPKRKGHPVVLVLILVPLLIAASFAVGMGVFEATKKCADKAESDRLVGIENQMRRDFLNDLGNVPIGSVEAYEQQVLSPDLVNRAANAHALAEVFSDYPGISDLFLSAEQRLDHAASLVLRGSGDYMKKMSDESLAAYSDMRLGLLKADDEARAC